MFAFHDKFWHILCFSIDGYVYQCSTYYSGALPIATDEDALASSGGGLSFDVDSAFVTLPSATSYVYLVAAYDGRNSGVQVWNIADILACTTIEILRYARPGSAGGSLLVDGYNGGEGPKHQMTGWTLLNPHTVPDGGITAALLGLGIGALAMVRRMMC
jgi:hypothetical protein